MERVPEPEGANLRRTPQRQKDLWRMAEDQGNRLTAAEQELADVKAQLRNLTQRFEIAADHLGGGFQ